MMIMKIGIMILEVYQTFLLSRARLFYAHHVIEYAPAKTGEYPKISLMLHSPIFNYLFTMMKAVV